MVSLTGFTKKQTNNTTTRPDKAKIFVLNRHLLIIANSKSEFVSIRYPGDLVQLIILIQILKKIENINMDIQVK